MVAALIPIFLYLPIIQFETSNGYSTAHSSTGSSIESQSCPPPGPPVHILSPPNTSSWGRACSIRRQTAPRWTRVSFPFEGTGRQESPAAGPKGAYVWRNSLEYRGSPPSRRGGMRRAVEGGGGVRAPRRPQLVLSHSRPLERDGMVAQSHGRSSRRPTSPPTVQSFLLLSPLLSDRSTRRTNRPRPPGLFSLLSARIRTHTHASPAPRSVVHIRCETLLHMANTRQTRAAALANQNSPGVLHPLKG